jgi:ABC-2 type transport system ATP-binding protein
VDAAAFEDLPGVDDVRIDDRTLTCLLRGEPDPLLKEAAKRKVVGWTAEERELEDLFLDFYREPGDEPHDPEEVSAHGR